MKNKTRKFLLNRHVIAGAALITLIAAQTLSGAPKNSLPVVKSVGKPKFTTVGGEGVPLANARTVPHFSFDAVDPSNGATYQLTMVGADPASKSSTTVPTIIIPLRLRFANGAVLDGGSRVDAVLASPVFAANTYSAQMAAGDVGQYGDVFMRAQFNKIGTGYHLLLDTPSVLPTVTIDIPQNQGFGVIVPSPAGEVLVGLADINWFSARLQNLLGQLHIPSTALPIFLTDNSMLYIDTPDNCCVIGYHGEHGTTGKALPGVKSKGQIDMQTFIYAAYTTPGTFGASGLQDIHALSHEVAEWLDDPFITNFIQPWLTPTAPQYGCTPVLETGDPVVGIWFPLPGNPDPNPMAQGVWHPEEEVFWPWFLRQAPSSSFGGHYTFMGSDNPFLGFTLPATGCN